jgi:4-hydroxybenzoate polyprenyltransferase
MHVAHDAVLRGTGVGDTAAAFYFAGVAVVGALLIYEQSLVRADDLSQVKRAFDMNGYVGILYLFVLALSIYVR